MKIAPVDVAHKSFNNKVWGFSPDEVHAFLRDVADQMEELVRERNSLKEAMREKELAIHEYKQRDETLKATITTATKMSEQIRLDSEREARLIVQDAQQRGELITKDARDQLRRTYQEIADLKRLRMQFETSMKSLLSAHQQMLEQANAILPELPNYAAPAAAGAGATSSAQVSNVAPATAAKPAASSQPARSPSAPIAPLSQLHSIDFVDSGTPIRPR